MQKNGLTYAEAGVDIDAGNALVERIKPAARQTQRAGTMSGLGGFGALFDLKAAGFADPILVAATDGVGTKLKIARLTDRHNTVGIDLVAMCANDVIVQGAEPLFFLDYIARGKLDSAVAGDVIAGIAEGCLQAGAALIGGETAEMPDMYAPGEYDLAGFTVGAVERDALIDGSAIAAGDVIVGIASSGPHSNGYSLIRKVLERAPQASIDGTPASEVLLAPTKIYVKPVLSLLEEVEVKGLAHITGGGITENVPRVLPEGLGAEIDTTTWQPGPVFEFLQEQGNIETAEMRRTFNCGVGMVVVVAAADVVRTIALLEASGESAWRIGEITSGSRNVTYL